MDVLTLNCWVRSEEASVIFQVKNISKTATVCALQVRIKNKDPAAFRDVDADGLTLYKPKHPLSEPHKDTLSKLILSEHAERLGVLRRLSTFFPEQPPEFDIHIIVDAPSAIVCYLRGSTLNDSESVSILPGEDVDQLKKDICAHPNLSKRVADHQIRLYKISGDENKLQESLRKTGGGELLQSGSLAPKFLDVPVLDPLRVVIETPVAGDGSFLRLSTDSEGLTNTLPEVQGPASNVDGVQEYKYIFVKVKNWEIFEESDITRNRIEELAEHMDVPAFVSTFEDKLVQKPCLPLDVIQQSISTEYFEPHPGQNSTAEGSQEERRCADLFEVMHTTYHVAHYAWEQSWCKKPLKERMMGSIFFDPLLFVKNRRDTTVREKDWPLYVVVKRDAEDEIRQYLPRSDFLIKNSTLPRLLVEINSVPWAPFPRDLVRMLVTGAFLVRFANNFVSTFKQDKNFVLCCFYIWFNGKATRYILFQTPNSETVYYNEFEFDLDKSLDRVKFVRHLYNLRAESSRGQDEDAENAVTRLCSMVKQSQMKSMYTKAATDGDRSRKRSRTENNHGEPAGGGNGNGHTAQLRAHGYEVEPKVFIDDSGGTWAPIYKTSDHILTVYRHANSSKKFIAKKVWEESNELDILKFLDTMRLKSDLSDWSIHVISLADSFDGWAILPKMVALQNYLDWNCEVFESHVPQACLGLIKGLAYLHKLLIAHGDIKPNNLVVDKNLTLKIIDFDVAIRLKDEDQEVNDSCGTNGWMAPEVKKDNVSYSPIKADRWSCGRVLLFLLDSFGKEESSLRAFAKDLMAHDPKRRPSLLQQVAPPSSDSTNPVASKASRFRRERVEDDGEITKLPIVKKQRLDPGQCNMSGS